LTAAFGGLAALDGGTASAEPAWCAGAGGQRLDSFGNLKDALKHEEPRYELMSLTRRLCQPDPEDKEARQELETAMKRWAKRLDISDAEWSDIANYATLGQSERMGGRVQMAPAPGQTGSVDPFKRAWTALTPLDQFALIDIGGSGDSMLALDDHYVVDALGLGLSETGRLAYVSQCLGTSEPTPVAWAMCNRDVERLDLKRISAELRADKAYRGADKISVRIRMDELKPVLVQHKAKIKKLIASDPGYAKMFALADATVETWNGRYQSHGELLALVSAMEDARTTRSRKALAGCEDKTWEAWKTAMSEIPAARFDGMHDAAGESFLDKAMGPVISHSSTYLAAIAMAICRVSSQERGTQQDVLIRALGDAMQRWPGYRGPRTETETAIMSAGIELDDRDAKLDYPNVYRDFSSGGGSRSGGGSGVIAKLKAGGKTTKTTTIEFKKQLVKQVQCAQAKSTARVTQIRPDGSLIYETRCVKNETVVVDKSDDPQQVNPRYLEGVKPGMFVTVIEDVPTGVWSKPGSAKPTMVFGAPVK
jgi:hypothetical protein